MTDFLYLVLHLTCKVKCYFRLFSSVFVSVLQTSINVLSKSKSRNYITWIANLTKLFTSVYGLHLKKILSINFNQTRNTTINPFLHNNEIKALCANNVEKCHGKICSFAVQVIKNSGHIWLDWLLFIPSLVVDETL